MNGRFGYADDLSLLPDTLVPPLVLSQGSTAEFSQVHQTIKVKFWMTLLLVCYQAGLDFLTALFAKHDLDQDQALSPQELVSLFSICPLNPWGPEVYHQTPTNHKNWVGLPGYLALWHLKTLLEPHHCSSLLAHLGYDYHAPALPARPPPLVATKDRKVNQQLLLRSIKAKT